MWTTPGHKVIKVKEDLPAISLHTCEAQFGYRLCLDRDHRVCAVASQRSENNMGSLSSASSKRIILWALWKKGVACIGLYAWAIRRSSSMVNYSRENGNCSNRRFATLSSCSNPELRAGVLEYVATLKSGAYFQPHTFLLSVWVLWGW